MSDRNRSFFLVEDTGLRNTARAFLELPDLEVLVRSLSVYDAFISEEMNMYEDSSSHIHLLEEKIKFAINRGR